VSLVAIQTIFTFWIAFALATGVASAASGSAQMEGIVLGIDRGGHLATVRHEPFAGMPAMTMTFQSGARTIESLEPGERIRATVDLSTEPWTIVRAERSAAAPAKPPAGVVPWVPQVHEGDLLPDARFIDQDGRQLTSEAWRGRPLVLAFIYTRCRDPRMCPLISAKFQALQRRLAGSRAHLLEVTLDPAYDRGDVLRRYAQTFGADAARWTLATGDPIEILTFAKRFGIETERAQGDVIIHSERTAIVGSDGRIGLLLDGNRWAPSDIVTELAALERGANSPLALGRLWLSQAYATICGTRGERTFSAVLTLAALLVVGGAGLRAVRR
jgi:protein SCO1/2